MSYTEIAKPTTTYSETGKPFSFLLINDTDFLLISTEKLIISETGNYSLTSISKPTTSYTTINKPT